MLECQTPIVTSVRGWAIGLGLDLALASDFVVAAEDARFWSPFTGIGFTPDSGNSWLLPRMVGVARAKSMIMLGRKVTGIQAAEWGLIHEAVPGDSVDEVTEALIAELRSAATVAVGLAKLLVFALAVQRPPPPPRRRGLGDRAGRAAATTSRKPAEPAREALPEFKGR